MSAVGGWTSPVPCRNIFFKYVTSTREDERSDVSAKISRRQPTRRALMARESRGARGVEALVCGQ